MMRYTVYITTSYYNDNYPTNKCMIDHRLYTNLRIYIMFKF